MIGKRGSLMEKSIIEKTDKGSVFGQFSDNHMKKLVLGNTGIEVSPLCFGVLPMGPLQKNLSPQEGGKLIRQALEEGVNFLDTAVLYQTYPHIKEGIGGYSGDVVIASKSEATTYEDMEKDVLQALAALGRDYIDIFHLHAARVKPSVFTERAGALECLKDLKKQGLIRGVGMATHCVDVVEASTEREDIDVIFPLINQLGTGVLGGTKEEMARAITKAEEAGKGVYVMKALAGGNLIDRLPEAIAYVREIPGVSAVAIGMVDEKELALNLKIFNGEEFDWALGLEAKKSKKLWVSFFCTGCGTCIQACPNEALSLVSNKAVVDHEICLLCGYCSPACPEFALRMV